MMWFNGVLTAKDDGETSDTGTLSCLPSWLAFESSMLVNWVVCKADSFCLQTSINYDNHRRSGMLRIRTCPHTFPYTRASTPAVSSCSSVQRLHFPVVVSDHTLKDLRGSNAAVDPASSLNGLPAHRTFLCWPFLRKTMKSRPPADNGISSKPAITSNPVDR